MEEQGQVFGIRLIDSLPIDDGSRLQAMPSRADLRQVHSLNRRTAAGYESLLAHYRNSIDMIRDAVLNERSQLEGMGLTGDQINAVLAVIDEFTPDGLLLEDDE